MNQLRLPLRDRPRLRVRRIPLARGPGLTLTAYERETVDVVLRLRTRDMALARRVAAAILREI